MNYSCYKTVYTAENIDFIFFHNISGYLCDYDPPSYSFYSVAIWQPTLLG